MKVIELCRNQKVRRTNKLQKKGVCLTRNRKRFRATITVNGKQTQIGVFDTSDEAKEAYNKAAIAMHGEFFRLN